MPDPFLNSSLQPDMSSIRSGSLSLLLTTHPDAVREAQRLRHNVFFHELGAAAADQLDHDDFDALCEHLLVVEHAGPTPHVVGTYRLLRRTLDHPVARFYTESEFDISALLAQPKPMMELGRSCVAPQYRDGRVIQMLWRGIAQYIVHHQLAYMFGCASFTGANPEKHRMPLSYLHHHHLADAGLRASPLPEMAANIDVLPLDQIDVKTARAELPPLIKGYLRLGGVVGAGAVIDPVFDTTDICILVDSARITSRYTRFYGDQDQLDFAPREKP